MEGMSREAWERVKRVASEALGVSRRRADAVRAGCVCR